MKSNGLVKVLCIGCHRFIYFKDYNGKLVHSPDREATMISHGVCENCFSLYLKEKEIYRELEKLGIQGGA